MISTGQNILVTGGAGFVGTHLVRKLVELGFRPISLDLKDPAKSVEGVEYVRGDARDATVLDRLMALNMATVYHLAATVSVPLCQKDPLESYSNNFGATLAVLEAIRRDASRRGASPTPLIFASTAAIYGMKGDDMRALKEHDIAEEFLSFYAAQKHASEEAILLYRAYHGVPATMFRFFNIYGEGQDPTSPYSGVITLFQKFASEGKPLPLNGGGVATRDFISVHDIVQGCVKPLSIPVEQWNPLPMNLGTNTRVSIRELAGIIRKAYGDRSELTTAPAREGDVMHSLADITRAVTTLGFKPTRTLADGLAELISGKSSPHNPS